MEETVTISKRLYHELLEYSEKLNALEFMGVEDWHGYAEAMRHFEDTKIKKGGEGEKE